MRGWAAPKQIVQLLVYGPDGPGTSQAAMLQFQTGAELDGKMGTPHYGMEGEDVHTFGGWVANPQEYRGAAQLGAITTPPYGDEPALPNAAAPGALPDWVETWTRLEGLVP
jgi:hypothetical protein